MNNLPLNSGYPGSTLMQVSLTATRVVDFVFQPPPLFCKSYHTEKDDSVIYFQSQFVRKETHV